MAPFHRLRRACSTAARTPTRGAGFGRLVELLVFALAAPLAGRSLFPDDPLGIASGFPWAAVGPLVFAARYGIDAGLGCAAVAIAGIALGASAYPEATSAVVSLAIGTVVLAVVIGDTATSWRRRALRSEAENVYLRHRLKEFSNDYHVLKVSHGQLEEFMAGQRLSLRQALQQIGPALSSGGSSLGSGAELMAVFAQFCSVQVAGLYAMKNETLVDGQALAVHGDMGELPMFDPLLRLAIAERQLVSVRLDSAADNQHESELLAVVPIVDSRDRMHGVLAIRDMHFMAFQQQNLNILALLAGYVGDRVARAGGLGDEPAGRFVAELDTALRFARSHAVRSSLLVLQLAPHVRTPAIAEFLSGAVRSLDSAWLPPRNGASDDTKVVVLLPLIGERGCRAWRARVEAMVTERFDVALSSLVVAEGMLPLVGDLTRIDCLAFVRDVATSDRSVTLVDDVSRTARTPGPSARDDAVYDLDDDPERIDRVA